MNKSIGSLEFRSISKGIEVSNEILKRSTVDIVYGKSICPGKFLIIISGDASEVQEGINYGLEIEGGYLVDSFILNRVHEDIIDGLKNRYKCKKIDGLAIGIIETTKVCKGIEALDISLKSSHVNLVKLQLAFGIGGKLVYIVSGTLSSVEYSINKALDSINKKYVVSSSIIPSPEEKLMEILL